MELSTAQQEVVDQHRSSPLAWVGSTPTYAPCVVCPRDSNNLYGLRMSEATVKALLEMGVMKHGPLSEEQRQEFDRRKGHLQYSAPTHGYLFHGRE